MNSIIITIPDNIARIKQVFFDTLHTMLTSEYHYQVEISLSHEHIHENLEMNQQINAVLFDLSAGGLDFCANVVALNNEMPIFAFVAKGSELHVNLYFFSYKTDQIHTICERIDTTIKEYLRDLIPPFTQTLMSYAVMNRYHYCTPGHSSGLAFLRSPAGRLFHDFFGENIFKSDLSVSMTELGSLLDHSGKFKEAEEYNI
jgi:lysine decarboxylase